MKGPLNKIWLCLLLLLTTNVAFSAEYRLATGDEIKITVYGEDDLTSEVVIDQSGTLIYPFIGRIPLAGQTLNEIRLRIDAGLRGDYLINPEVDVSIVHYRPFYIRGEVKKPGAYEYAPGMTVLRAITMAGGYSLRASKDKLHIARERDPERQYRVKSGTTVQPGDIVTVGQSIF